MSQIGNAEVRAAARVFVEARERMFRYEDCGAMRARDRQELLVNLALHRLQTLLADEVLVLAAIAVAEARYEEKFGEGSLY